MKNSIAHKVEIYTIIRTCFLQLTIFDSLDFQISTIANSDIHFMNIILNYVSFSYTHKCK
ncbi:hypothetical protein JHK86_056351 [Glycine max]|nr:hypothetical protein JHK86_056351 [Glycine max]